LAIVGAGFSSTPGSDHYSHLSFHPMHRSGADAKYFSRFENARSGRQLFTDKLYDIGAHGATPDALPLCSGTREAQVDAAANDRPLELCECASYLVEQASCRRRGVDVCGADPR
jgi:hypothetical protein